MGSGDAGWIDIDHFNRIAHRHQQPTGNATVSWKRQSFDQFFVARV
jgi:hypothetical protein